MHSAAQHERGCSAGLRPAPAEAEAEAEATAKADYPWDGGVGPVAGDAVNPSLGAWPRHPCRGHPRNRTHPAFDRFPRSVDPRHAWMNLCRITKSIGVRSVFQRKTDLTPAPHVVPGSIQPSPGNCRRRGGVGLRGVRGMDAAAKPPWTGLRRPRNPTPPRLTHRKPEPFWLWLWPWRRAGAGRSPADPPSPAHENDFTGFSKPSSLRHASTILRSSMRPRATHAKKRPPIA